MSGGAYITGDTALAAIVLWNSGFFDTASIAAVLDCREDAVDRTLRETRETARRSRPATPPMRRAA